MTDLKEMIERELESFIEWPTDDKSHVTTTSAKLFAEHVAKIYADHVAQDRKMVSDHIPGAGKMVTDATPAVQGEPVGWLIDWPEEPELGYYISDNPSEYARSRPLYIAPQPAEREIPGSSPVSGQIFFRQSSNEWVLELTGSVNGTTFTARHTQPADTRPEDVAGLPALYETAPDVEGLVEALESLIKGYVRLLQAGRDQITSLGGDCDTVPVMEQNDPQLRDARKALAAYRNGGEK